MLSGWEDAYCFTEPLTCLVSSLIGMDANEIFLCALGGVFVVMSLVRMCRGAARPLSSLRRAFYKYVVYPPLFDTTYTWAQCSRLSLLCRVLYVTGNVFCLLFRSPTTAKVGRQAGILAVINTLPLYLGAHHASTADWLGLTRPTFRSLHRDLALMAVAMGVIHSAIMLTSGVSFAWNNREHFYGALVRGQTNVPVDHTY